MIAHLLTGIEDAVQAKASPEALDLHLEGLAAIMESHFRYEERRLGAILSALEFDGDPQRAFGDL